MKKVFISLVFIFPFLLYALEPKYLYITGYSPPPQRKHRIAGGESFPPLPLPVVPLRRTEKKKPPSPPVILTKLKYGKGVQWVGYGENHRYLVKVANRALGIFYRADRKPLKRIDPDPSITPALYMTGLVSFKLSSEEVNKLREYLLQGGTLILDCNSGHFEIKDSFLSLIKELFPSLPLRPLPPDHPLFYSFYRIKKVRYQLAKYDPRIYNPSWEGKYPEPRYQEGPPLLYGLDIGSRTAIFLSTYDLGSGWAGKTYPYGNRFSVEDARKLGVNLIAYILQFYPVARYQSWERTYYLSPASSSTEFQIAQIVHSGYWDSSLTLLSRLLLNLRKVTRSLPQLEPALVELKEGVSLSYPLFYLTGHDRIEFSPRERKILREYVERGGVIFAENRLGRSTFDKTFRKELNKIFPEGKLTKVPPSHPLFRIFYNLKRVRYSPWVEEFPKGVGEPVLEILKFKGREVLVYSPYDLAWSWQDEVYPPYTRGVKGEDGLKLGTNILVYLLTH